MKHIKKDFKAWMLICLFLVIIFVIYNQLDNEHDEKSREDTPLTEALHPTIKKKTDQLVEIAAKKDIHVVITDTVRTMEEQDRLYAKGRSAEGNIVTDAQAGESYHNYGLAIDYAIENKKGNVIWDTGYDGNNNGKSDWFEVADIAKELGFEWGGDWQGFKDYPHLQITFGLSIRQLQNGERPDS